MDDTEALRIARRWSRRWKLAVRNLRAHREQARRAHQSFTSDAVEAIHDALETLEHMSLALGERDETPPSPGAAPPAAATSDAG